MRTTVTIAITALALVSATRVAAQSRGPALAKSAGGEADDGANADSKDEESLGELEDAPEEGVDADVELAFERARKALDTGNPAEASWILRSLYLSPDRFSKAQRDRKRETAVEMLERAGEQLAGRGDLAGAAAAYDAAWLLSDKAENRDYADILVRWAKREENREPGRALYMARRAERVDPSLDAARHMDDRLSANKNKTVGRIVQIAGGVIALGGVGMAIAMDNPRPGIYVGLAGLGVGGAGSYVFEAGVPNYRPTSPEALPALPDGED